MELRGNNLLYVTPVSEMEWLHHYALYEDYVMGYHKETNSHFTIKEPVLSYLNLRVCL
jgi:hypothetical protein